MVVEKELIIKKVNEYHNLGDEDLIYKGEGLLEEYLKNNPDDIDMLLRLGAYVLAPPIVNDLKTMDCVYKILNIDKNNVEAVLLYACANLLYCFENYQEALDLLLGLKTDDPEKLSMIEYAKSWSYEYEYKYDQFEQALIKSVQLYPFHVWNCRDLGRLYIKQGRKSEGFELLSKAIGNVKIACNSDHEVDWTDANEYLDEFIRGTHIPDSLYESLKNELLEVS